jgi:hypothetical protein
MRNTNLLAGKKLIFCAFILTAPFVAAFADSAGNPRLIVGGPCEYEHFPARCRIVSLKKTDDSIKQKDVLGSPGYEGYEVKFEFILPQAYARDANAGITYEEYMENRASEAGYSLRELHTLRLTNSWYPGPEFIKKYKISKGAEFSCTLNLIKSGTCTPMIFSFDAIDLDDYFESAK